MRRILSVLTVAALVAAMMVIAGPANASTNISGGNSHNFNNGGHFVSIGSSFDDIDFGGIDFSD